MTGEVKDSTIPSLIQQVAEIDELVGKAQDKDLTNLEARSKLFEEQTEKITKAKHLGGGAVPGSDEEEVGGNIEGGDNVKLCNNSLNSFVHAAFYGLMGIEECSEQLKDLILHGYWVPDTSSKTTNDDCYSEPYQSPPPSYWAYLLIKQCDVTATAVAGDADPSKIVLASDIWVTYETAFG
ncbi:hypothetical protein JB92DRAFT_2826403 [Gautieria morchelliformis]|nr:hypothetical protein JB92DRAFT_2826403 [Gautieria morchelliformis]